MLPGYHKPYRLDISDRKGGLLVYIKSHLQSRLLKNFDIPKDTQIITCELNLRKEKWVFMYIYRPPSQNKQYFLDKLSEIIDHYSSIYDSYIILGDFTGAHLGEGSRGSGPLPFFHTVQIMPSNS